ncbi:hypothetical protein B0H16DRAFT_1895324 [Mycena metata]|uniref:Biotrophy-associated secreted protein 2 n=1 Tax=Mycena metata TaxID=1033252 RepID=A0AAD7HNR0_9AGAR|nr:hypothetical protein B0H16DRAFT_1895324 [Mycena metata]
MANVALLASSAAIPATVEARSGTQFITGPCSSDADCASGCCGFKTGKCAGPFVALIADGGCGHGLAKPKHEIRAEQAAAA